MNIQPREAGSELDSPRASIGAGKRTAFVLLTIALGLSVAALLGELSVRTFFRYNTPATVRTNSLQYVPSLFSRQVLRPNQRIQVDAAWGLRKDEKPTNRTYTINAMGCRGRDFSAAKPAGVRRIVILGGSSVFDLYATDGEDWPHLVEEKLRRTIPGGVEVINGGVPGHATFDALGRLYSQVWTWDPDYVLLYSAWNDVKYFTRLDRNHPLISLFPPVGEEADPLRSYQGILDELLCSSQLYVKLRTRYFLRKINLGAEGVIPGGSTVDSYGPLAVVQYRLDVQLFVDAARNLGITPVLLTEATLVTPSSTPQDQARIAYSYQHLTHEALAHALAEANDTVRSVAREKGAKLIDLAAGLNGQPNLFEDHVHTSKKGSEAIAEVVAEYLARALEPHMH